MIAARHSSKLQKITLSERLHKKEMLTNNPVINNCV